MRLWNMKSEELKRFEIIINKGFSYAVLRNIFIWTKFYVNAIEVHGRRRRRHNDDDGAPWYLYFFY